MVIAVFVLLHTSDLEFNSCAAATSRVDGDRLFKENTGKVAFDISAAR